MKALQDLKIFLLTAQLGSLSACARQMNLTPAATSAAIKRLEAELDVMLFVRSTRRLRLTQEGELFRQHCQEALQILDDGIQTLSQGVELIRGRLQLSTPSDLGRNLLLSWLDEFEQRFPHIELALQVTDRLSDLYSQPVDLVLRYGEPASSNLIALPVAAHNRRMLCAAPSYLQQHGTPATPEQLQQHHCLCYMLGEYHYDRWRFVRDGEELTIKVHAKRLSDDGDVVRRWAVAGHGIAYKSQLDIAQDLSAGRLVAVCPDWQGEAAPLNLLCADRRQLNPAVRTLHQELQVYCLQVLAQLSNTQ